MPPDKLQQAWQAHSSRTRVTIDADLLLKEVQRSHGYFHATIFWRDFREVGVALVMLPLWFYLGITFSLPWTWYLTVPALLWVAGFILVDRMRHKRKPSEPGEPLLESVKESLAQVEHQIWLLRNVFWWYLLPSTISILAFFVHVGWLRRDWWGTLGSVVFLAVVYGAIYHLNQVAVRCQLEPRRRELLSLLAGLGEVENEEYAGAGSFVPEMSRAGITEHPAERALTIVSIVLLMVTLVVLGIAATAFDNEERTEYPKRAPYTGIRWEGDTPVVKIGEDWLTLVSIDGIAAEEIVEFSQRTYKDDWRKELWRKRFEEDLVEVLMRMGHEPKDTVQLVVLPSGSSTPRTLEGVRMTESNRQVIYRAGAVRARERSEHESGQQDPVEQRPAARSAVPIDDGALFRARIDEFLNAAHSKFGFSGAVLVARGGQPLYQGTFGFSHLESKAANTIDTPFRIVSLSKQFTAAAIFRLEAEGKLGIDDPVHKYLPEFSELSYRRISIHHLLTHTSGLPRIPESVMGQIRWGTMSRAATPVDDYVRLAVKTPLKFEPGAAYEYSNFGYRVLAAVIVRITGRDYADFMEQELFQPLGMKNSGVARLTRPTSESRIAEGLSFLRLDVDGKPLFANGEGGRNFGTGYGSGGIYSSANNLLRWDRVLAGDAFLSESQKERLFQPIHGNYACGWIVKKSDLDGRLCQMHNGANDGFFSQMMRVPEDDLVIIAVGNVEATPAMDDILEQLFRCCQSLPYRDP
jgi:CubicO group peptidase (beta-lactamase class C family)